MESFFIWLKSFESSPISVSLPWVSALLIWDYNIEISSLLIFSSEVVFMPSPIEIGFVLMSEFYN